MFYVDLAVFISYIYGDLFEHINFVANENSFPQLQHTVFKWKK